ncbi:hypothetical protein [Zophobihabitans entericus]|uniref:Uncharacterized protein n=1 Tax=Zophobihabitans entericus TaxID=1635327 RepID=A0A6G9IB15_9GAMM|nr:hypothetical protein [Zophobihabitans entericus]QIQ21425.1 hypothetical protein IPMB12_06825 [Zophobihabitans entericus]
MEDFLYFVRTFVAKNRQERWIYLSTKKWEKFADFNGMENDFNENCILYENNAEEIFFQTVQDKGINRGVYLEYWSGISIMSPIDWNQINKTSSCESLLICKDEGVAFFFHHEGWIWVCKK